MNLDVETKRKLREMGCDRLVDAFCAQDDDLLAAVACAERVRLAVDDAYGMFLDDRVGGLVRRARLRYPNADLRSIEMVEERGLNRDVINQLSTCAWIGRHRNVVF